MIHKAHEPVRLGSAGLLNLATAPFEGPFAS
jgi:hypothetical protein